MAELKVTLAGNQSGFQATLAKARAEARTFANDLAREVGGSWMQALSPARLVGGIGGFLGFEAVKSHLDGIIQRAGEIKDISEQFDMSTDSVQRWEKALGKAGIRFQTFLQAMETLRSNRQTAREGEQGMGKFTRLGIPEGDVRGNTTDEALLLRVLSSDASRAMVGDVVGSRGVRLKAALEHYSRLEGQPMDFSAEDINSVEQASSEYKTAVSKLKGLSAKRGPGALVIGLSKILHGEFSAGFGNVGDAIQGMSRGGISGGIGFWRLMYQRFAGGRGQPAGAINPERIETEDPELALRRKLKEQQVEKSIADEQSRQFDNTWKLEEIQRQRMTTAEKHLSIQKEMEAIIAETAAIEGANPELRGSLRGRKDELIQRYAALKNQMIERPMDYNQAGVGRMGLFANSSLLFNPAMNISQEQLNVLRSIDFGIKRLGGSDPYEP